MLSDVTATMAEVSADASAMVPEKYAEVQRQIAELQTRFDHEDYAAVITEGPAILAAAHGLGQAAAARKAELSTQLSAQWAQRANALPDEFAAIERYLDFLAKPANRKAAVGIDVPGARDAVREAVSLWSKGQAAYAAGNLAEAVQIHLDLGAKRSVGVHWGTFQLADDPLDQPLHDLAGARRAKGLSEESFFLMPVGGTRRFSKREDGK